jgi:hypothetical protein
MGEAKASVVEITNWEKLQKFPQLRLLAGIIDPDEELEITDIMQAVATKFEIEYREDKDYIYFLQNKLSFIWRKNKWTENLTKTIFEIPVIGSVKMVVSYWRYIYIKDDVEYFVNFHPVAMLEVNSKVVESRVYDEEKMSYLEDELRTLFEKYDEACNYTDYYYMIQEVFNKGGEIEVFRGACRQMATKLHGVDSMDDAYPRTLTKCARFVFDKYMMYLWAQEEEQKPLEYRLGLSSFIHKNLPFWLEGDSGFELDCKLYTDEHKKIAEIFKAKEPEEQYLHILPPFLNLKVWNGWTKDSLSSTALDE